ncbi:MAG TPA: SDR family oxidoreductase [Stellaceae bacterium]|nr:SDR family oxidoreductase [Stellaceae bacterium]
MIVAITGASAGVGRAVAREFAARKWDVALIARDQVRLEAAVAELRQSGVRATAVIADVADFAALKAAADEIDEAFGPIDVWVNNAMATVFAPVTDITPEEFKRSTEVTYLGQVYGTMVALSLMRSRDRGTIVNIGSALAYRAIPLQSAYCGAKCAVRGFTDALRSELIHDRSAIGLVMVHLPAVNTPQFDWALNKTGRRAQPVPPIFQPEVAARAIYFAAMHPQRREVWVGMSTIKAIIGNKLAPRLLDWYLAGAGYRGQLTDEPQPQGVPANLFATVDADVAAHGRFDDAASDRSMEMTINTHRGVGAVVAVSFLVLGLASFFAHRRF